MSCLKEFATENTEFAERMCGGMGVVGGSGAEALFDGGGLCRGRNRDPQSGGQFWGRRVVRGRGLSGYAWAFGAQQAAPLRYVIVPCSD